MLEAQLQRLAEIVTVELERERSSRRDVEGRQVGLHVDGVRRLHPATAERAAEGPQDRPDLQRLERDRHETAVQCRCRAEVERPIAEVGVRIRVEHDREVTLDRRR